MMTEAIGTRCIAEFSALCRNEGIRQLFACARYRFMLFSFDVEVQMPVSKKTSIV